MCGGSALRSLLFCGCDDDLRLWVWAFWSNAASAGENVCGQYMLCF